ncbi:MULTISPECIES: SEL1-like repeat protein [Niastella]
MDAQRDLGHSYFYGEGIKRNEKLAVFWYKKAAAKMTPKPFII